MLPPPQPHLHGSCFPTVTASWWLGTKVPCRDCDAQLCPAINLLLPSMLHLSCTHPVCRCQSTCQPLLAPTSPPTQLPTLWVSGAGGGHSGAGLLSTFNTSPVAWGGRASLCLTLHRVCTEPLSPPQLHSCPAVALPHASPDLSHWDRLGCAEDGGQEPSSLCLTGPPLPSRGGVLLTSDDLLAPTNLAPTNLCLH